MIIRKKGDNEDQFNKKIKEFKSRLKNEEEDKNGKVETTEIANSDQLTRVIERLTPVIKKIQDANGVKTTTDNLTNAADTTEETKTEPIETKTEPIETKTEPIETKTEPIETKTEPIETKTEPIDWANKDYGPMPKTKRDSKPIKKMKLSPSIKKIIIFIIVTVLVVLFMFGLNALTANKTTDTDVTTNNTEMPLSFYEDTGISGSAEYKDFVVNDNQYLIIGGVFVAIDGVPYKYGAYIGLGPGTYNFNVNTGFISLVPSELGPSEFDFRVNQAVQNRWLHSTVDRGPIPVAPTPDPVA